MPKKMVKVMIAKGRVLLNPPTTNPPITDQPTIDHLLTNPPTNQPPTYRPKIMIAKGKVKGQSNKLYHVVCEEKIITTNHKLFRRGQSTGLLTGVR